MKYRILLFYKSPMERSRTGSKGLLDFGMGDRGFSLTAALVAFGLVGVLAVILMTQFEFLSKGTARIRSSQVESNFRQIIRFMNGESCTETFRGVRINSPLGGSITEIVDYDKASGASTPVFSIPNDDVSFKVVRIDVTPYNDGSGGPLTGRQGKATMNIYFKRPDSFIEKLEKNSDCRPGNIDGCFVDRCILDLEDTNPGTNGEAVGECRLLACSDGTSSGSTSSPDCYKVTQSVSSNKSQVLVGCGTAQSHSSEYTVAYGFNAGGSSYQGDENTFVGHKVGIHGSYSSTQKNTYFGRSIVGSSSPGSRNTVLAGSLSGLGGSDLTLICHGCSAAGNHKTFIKAGSSSIENSGEIWIRRGTIEMSSIGGSPYSSSAHTIEFETSSNKLTIQGETIRLGSGGGLIELSSVSGGNNMTVTGAVTINAGDIQIGGETISVDDITRWKDYKRDHDGNATSSAHSIYAIPGHRHGIRYTSYCPPPCCPPSDRRLKENIGSLDEGKSLEQVSKLKPVSFYWKDRDFFPGSSALGFVDRSVETGIPQLSGEDHHHGRGTNLKGLGYDLLAGGEQLGFVAQDVETTVPQLVTEDQGFLRLNILEMLPIIISAVKNLIKKVVSYSAQLKKLSEQIETDREELHLSQSQGFGENRLEGEADNNKESHRLSRLKAKRHELFEHFEKLRKENQWLKEQISELEKGTL